MVIRPCIFYWQVPQHHHITSQPVAMKDEQSRNQQRDQSNDGSSEQGINFTDRNPIAVGAEDYNWNPQRPFPAPNHDWAIGKNHNGGKGTTASVSTDLPIAQLSLKEGRPYQSIDRDFSPSHPKKIKQEKIHNVNVQKQTSRSRDDKKKKLGKKIEKDAAKNAAIYYGECYLEGVNMRHADKAARESHAGYKKWWLQQIQDENPITTLGDAYNVPLYNSPSKIPAQIKSRQEQMSLARDETRDIGGAANLAALATATHQSSAHSLAYSKCTTPGEMFDRSSGIRNPSPSKLTQTQAQTLGEKENRRAKKKKRSFSKLSRTIYDTCLGKNSQSHQRNISWDAVSTKNNAMYNVSQSQQCKASAIPIPSASHENAYIYGIDPNATTDDDVPVPDQHSIGSQSLYKAHFQRERRNGQRRESSSCDRNDETHSTDPPRRTTASSDERSEEGNAVCQYFGNNGGISISNPNTTDNIKLEVIRALAVSGGDVTSTQFLSALDQLRRLYAMTCFDARLGHKSNKKKIEGNWLTISRPHFQECLGSNSSGEYMYTLGRLSFDMFTPGNLICSIGGIFNSIETVDVHSDTCALKSIPKSLKVEVEKGESILRRYE